MTGMHYLVLAYAVSLALLWGYAFSLWLAHRAMARRAAASGGPPPGRADGPTDPTRASTDSNP